MGLEAVAIFLVLISICAVPIYGLVSGRKSTVVLVLSAVVSVLAVIGAWYSWAESRSVPWTVGYGVMAAVAFGSMVRQRVR